MTDIKDEYAPVVPEVIEVRTRLVSTRMAVIAQEGKAELLDALSEEPAAGHSYAELLMQAQVALGTAVQFLDKAGLRPKAIHHILTPLMERLAGAVDDGRDPTDAEVGILMSMALGAKVAPNGKTAEMVALWKDEHDMTLARRMKCGCDRCKAILKAYEKHGTDLFGAELALPNSLPSATHTAPDRAQ